MDKIVKIPKFSSQYDVSVPQEAKEKFFQVVLIKNSLRLNHAATEREIKKFLGKTSNATCKLDPLPTALLKECSTTLLPVLTTIINLSFFC